MFKMSSDLSDPNHMFSMIRLVVPVFERYLGLNWCMNIILSPLENTLTVLKLASLVSDVMVA